MKYRVVLMVLLCSAFAKAQTDPDIYDKFNSEFITVNGYKINLEIKGDGMILPFNRLIAMIRLTAALAPSE